MNEKRLAELYSCTQAHMKAKLLCSRVAFDHAPTKGSASETDWITYLRDYLPKRYCVDSAFVVDSQNHVSDQIDVVIYDQQYSFLVFDKDGFKYVPAESVYAVFEVKQVLNKEYMDYASEKAQSVRQLFRTTSTVISANGNVTPRKQPRILAGILALDSEWANPIDSQVVANMIGHHTEEQLDLVCCIEKGSFSAIRDDSDKSIIDVKCTDSENSVIFFFLEFVKKLQAIGTVCPIKIDEYEKSIPVKSGFNKGE